MRACACQPEHEAFKQLLAAPQDEAKSITRRRFPVPKIVDCDQNGSQVGGGWGEAHLKGQGRAQNTQIHADTERG